MTIMPGYHTSAYNLGAQSHWRPLRVMANNKSELPPRCTSPVPERSDFPPVTGGDQSYLDDDISAGATVEGPGKISLSTRQPAQSAILICERRAVSRNFISFCCALDSNRYQHHNIWPKAVTKASHKGYWWALCPCRPSSNCSHQSC